MINTPLSINSANGLLEPVNYRPSPHCDLRAAGMDIDLLVIHCISLPPGEFGGDAIERFFCGELNANLHPYFKTIENVKVSAHLLIKRDGSIIQFVPFTKRAWHAGESFFEGKMRCNDFSIGIELEGTDYLPYEKIQYEVLSNVIRLLKQNYPAITDDRIVSHSDIAPHRKTDPGPQFDWAYLKGRLA